MTSWVDRFIDECVVPAPPQHRTSNTAVWDAYLKWAYTRVTPPDRAKRRELTRRLEELGYVQARARIDGKHKRYWFGLALRRSQ
jgi:hypothetical protein